MLIIISTFKYVQNFKNWSD